MKRVSKRERKYRVATARVLHMMRRPFEETDETPDVYYGAPVEEQPQMEAGR